MEKNNENPVFINANETPEEGEETSSENIEMALDDQAPESLSTNNEVTAEQEQTQTPEKPKNPNKHLTNLKRITLAFVGLLALRGGGEIAKDVKEAKAFIEESGYTATEFFESAWRPVLYFDEETNTITIDSPATLKKLSNDQFTDISEKNQAEVEEYIEDLNKNNPQVYINSQGELGPGSQIKVPSSIEERSPLKALLDYAFTPLENEREIEQSPNIKPNPDRESAEEQDLKSEPETYTIQPGDSLWEIASKMIGESGINHNPSTVMDVIAYLKEINNLEDSDIVAGKTLNVPSLEEMQKFETTTEEAVE